MQPDVRRVHGGDSLPERRAVRLVRHELRGVQRGIVRQVQERDVPNYGQVRRMHDALEPRRVLVGRTAAHGA